LSLRSDTLILRNVRSMLTVNLHPDKPKKLKESELQGEVGTSQVEKTGEATLSVKPCWFAFSRRRSPVRELMS